MVITISHLMHIYMLHALTGLEQDKKRTAGGSGVGGVELAEILLHGTPLGKDLSRFFFIFLEPFLFI